MIPDFNVFIEKIFAFVTFPLSGFALVINLRNFDFESR